MKKLKCWMQRLLAVMLFINPALVYAESPALSAHEIYDRSINIFTHPHMSFVVDSETLYAGEVSEKRSFFAATKEEDSNKSSVLIRFMAPQDIKCTSVLINKEAEKVSRYVYFPSLKRVRVIPDSDRQKEVMGMGISFEEMSSPEGSFAPIETVGLNGETLLKLALINENKTTFFWIKPESLDVRQIEVYEHGVLQKQVFVTDVRNVYGEKVVFAWTINDLLKERQLTYKIREESLTDKVDSQAFHKNLLKRCRG